MASSETKIQMNELRIKQNKESIKGIKETLYTPETGVMSKMGKIDTAIEKLTTIVDQNDKNSAGNWDRSSKVFAGLMAAGMFALAFATYFKG